MRSFNNKKYFLSNVVHTKKRTFLLERVWLLRYIMLDARFSKITKQFTKNFLINYFSRSLSRSKLRSKCFFSRSRFGISKHLFWMGRHSANQYFKTGRIVGFKKC